VSELVCLKTWLFKDFEEIEFEIYEVWSFEIYDRYLFIIKSYTEYNTNSKQKK